MQVTRERKQTVTVEFGLAEADALAKEIKTVFPRWASGILEQLRQRLEHHVAAAKSHDPTHTS